MQQIFIYYYNFGIFGEEKDAIKDSDFFCLYDVKEGHDIYVVRSQHVALLKNINNDNNNMSIEDL